MDTTASPSGISQALRAYAAARGGVSALTAAARIADGRGGELRLRVANDRDARDAAYRLAHRVYRRLGYVDDGERLVGPIDALPGTITFLIESEDGEPAATVTIVPDSPVGVQADALYRPLLDHLRRAGRRLGEVTRLAVDARFVHSRPLLARLIELCYVYAFHVRGLSDLLIEVTPRHGVFYERMVGFVPISDVRLNPRVGVDGVLMRVALARMAEMARAWAGHPSPPSAASVYALFYPPRVARVVAAAIAADHRPMTDDDRDHFAIRGHPAPGDRP